MEVNIVVSSDDYNQMMLATNLIFAKLNSDVSMIEVTQSEQMPDGTWQRRIAMRIKAMSWTDRFIRPEKS